jgi:hypothetical protein
MVLSERVWETCKCCGKNEKLLQEAVFGCDNCTAQLSGERLAVWIHGSDEGGRTFDLCSWACVFAFLRNYQPQTDEFVSLPFLSFGDMPDGARAEDFFKLVSTAFSN